jgi:hypothetical protein
MPKLVQFETRLRSTSSYEFSKSVHKTGSNLIFMVLIFLQIISYIKNFSQVLVFLIYPYLITNFFIYITWHFILKNSNNLHWKIKIDRGRSWYQSNCFLHLDVTMIRDYWTNGMGKFCIIHLGSHRKMLAIISVEVFVVPILRQLSSLASIVTLISSWNLFDSSVHEMLASGENYESSSSR